MNKLTIKSKEILFVVSNLEKKHKIITYVSLLFLTVSTYFLRSENKDVKIEFATLQERNLGLKQNMVFFNRNFEDFPLPIWQKVKRGDRFIVNYISPAYLKQFGHNFNNDMYEVIGKNNFEIFPKKIAQGYYENDIAVSITGTQIEAIEEYLDKEGEVQTLKFLIWRDIWDNKDTLIYGMVQETLPPKKKIEKSEN